MVSIDNKIRVAILGGGLAGAAVFRGLVKLNNLKVDIFESAPAFREQGQAIGFNHNAIWALELLGLKERLSGAGAVRINSMRCMIGQGPQAGEMSFEANVREKGTWIVQRSSFLSEMLKEVDSACMHAGKKLKHLEQGDEIKLFFDDGSTHVCDVLLGADGIHSTTRKYVIGHDHPAAAPAFGGWWTVWTLVPFDKAQEHLGKELMNPDEPRQYCWIGETAWVMHDQLSDNTLTQLAIAMRVPEDSVTDPSDWRKTVTKEELQRHLKGFHGSLEKGVVELVSDSPEPISMYSLWHHRPMAPNYVKDNIAIVGDAADATTPWQGSGGGMSVEDAFILSELFGQVQTVSDAKAALKAYEQINQPRRQRLVDSSYDTGLTFTGCIPEVGMDPEKVRERLEHRWDWIMDVDLVDNKNRAIQAMDGFKK